MLSPTEPPAPPEALEQFLAAFPPPIGDLTLQTRALLLARRPDLVEKVWPGWRMIGYGTSPKMADLVVGLGPATRHLDVQLMGGHLLPDPDGLLEGTSKAARHVKVRSHAQLESAAVQALIDATFALADARTATPPTAAPQAAAPGGWRAPVADDAVAAKTGHSWSEWLTALDAEGCAMMTHPEIVAVVASRGGVGPWWQQMVTVGYERARGLREPNQTSDGYQVGASKTVAAPLDRLWSAWHDAASRGAWLEETFMVRRATAGKSMRITWNDGSDLQVLFYARGAAKSQVTVDHRRLPDAARVEEQRAFWRSRLEALKRQVER